MKWLIAPKILLKIPWVMWKAWREYNSLYRGARRCGRKMARERKTAFTIAWPVARQCGVTERELMALLRQLQREERRERRKAIRKVDLHVRWAGAMRIKRNDLT